MNVEGVVDKLKSSKPSFTCGVDPVGLSGGLVVYGWSPFATTCVCSSSNLVLCRIEESGGNFCYVLFVYGAPVVDDRPLV